MNFPTDPYRGVIKITADAMQRAGKHFQATLAKACTYPTRNVNIQFLRSATFALVLSRGRKIGRTTRNAESEPSDSVTWNWKARRRIFRPLSG